MKPHVCNNTVYIAICPIYAHIWASQTKYIDDDTASGFRRKTLPHNNDRPRVDLFKLTPIPPVRKYRKPAWGNENESVSSP